MKIPEKSIILLHACAHNPTGVGTELIELIEALPPLSLSPFQTRRPNNGPRYRRFASRGTSTYSSTWLGSMLCLTDGTMAFSRRIKALPPAILTVTPMQCAHSLRPGMTFAYLSRTPRTWDCMVSIW